MNSRPNPVAVTMYATRYCSYCMRARQLLESKGVAYKEILVDNDPASRREMEYRSGARTVPQIFFGDRCVGGFDALRALEIAGELDRLLFGEQLQGCA